MMHKVEKVCIEANETQSAFGGVGELFYFRIINFKKEILMEKNNALPLEALTKGYVLIPKSLLEQWLQSRATPLSELDAWLTVLTAVNYKDVSYTISTHTVVCKRGESLHSLSTWAALFHWTYGKARCTEARRHIAEQADEAFRTFWETYHLCNVKYYMQAAGYLYNKALLNEYFD